MAKLRRCPCQGETLDRLIQPAVLAFLAREPMSGYRLLRLLDGMPMFREHKPDPAGVYRCLKMMERRGLVTGSWSLSHSGPASRRFRLTRAGQSCLARWVETLVVYRQDLDFILALTRKASRKNSR